MERELLRLSETPLHLEKTWESGGVPVLTAEVTDRKSVVAGQRGG